MQNLNNQKNINVPILVLVGPTAVGKTDLSLELGEQYNCEIVSIDSMQIYRYMDIGTAKPTKDEKRRIKHHLIDIINPDNDYNAAYFAKDALDAINKIIKIGKIPLLTGGTGLYLKALLEGFFEITPIDKEIRFDLQKRLDEFGREFLHSELQKVDKKSADRIHINDTQRLLRALEIFYSTGVSWSAYLEDKHAGKKNINFSNMIQIGLMSDRQKLYSRIEVRTKEMIKQGLIEEVQGLLDRGYPASLKSMQSIGYKHINNYLTDRWSKEKTIEILIRDTRRYAKRQMTWFKKMPSLNWFERGDITGIKFLLNEWLMSI